MRLLKRSQNICFWGWWRGVLTPAMCCVSFCLLRMLCTLGSVFFRGRCTGLISKATLNYIYLAMVSMWTPEADLKAQICCTGPWLPTSSMWLWCTGHCSGLNTNEISVSSEKHPISITVSAQRGAQHSLYHNSFPSARLLKQSLEKFRVSFQCWTFPDSWTFDFLFSSLH